MFYSSMGERRVDNRRAWHCLFFFPPGFYGDLKSRDPVFFLKLFQTKPFPLCSDAPPDRQSHDLISLSPFPPFLMSLSAFHDHVPL